MNIFICSILMVLNVITMPYYFSITPYYFSQKWDFSSIFYQFLTISQKRKIFYNNNIIIIKRKMGHFCCRRAQEIDKFWQKVKIRKLTIWQHKSCCLELCVRYECVSIILRDKWVCMYTRVCMRRADVRMHIKESY